MVETSKKLTGLIDESMKFLTAKIVEHDIEDMSDDEFILLKMLLKTVKTSNELIIKQAETIEYMRKKLDELTKKDKEA